MRFWAALALAAALFSSHAGAQQNTSPLGPTGGGSGGGSAAPCSAFGTTTGTCLQGGSGNVPNNSLVTPPTTVGTAAVGQIPGTTTNDNASAGNVGEYVVSGASSFLNVNTTGASVTISIGAPGIISWTGNPYYLATATGNGCAALVVFSGAVPTGLVAGTNYYVTCNGAFTANAFNVSSSVANAIAGVAITTTGSSSGVTAGNMATLSSATAVDFGGFSLTAGDWDVTGIEAIAPASTTSVTFSSGGIAAGSLLTGILFSFSFQRSAAQVPGSFSYVPLSVERITISSTTTFFCGSKVAFSVSTMTAGGECRARRVR